MNPSSYKTIEQIINNASKQDLDMMVSVPVGDLRDIFRTVKRAFRNQGVLGFNDEGHPIVNDMGAAEIIRSVAEEDFKDIGTIKSIKVFRKYPEATWAVEVTFKTTKDDFVVTRSYDMVYLKCKRNFEYQLP